VPFVDRDQLCPAGLHFHPAYGVDRFHRCIFDSGIQGRHDYTSFKGWVGTHPPLFKG
jgi:hypothetical protein